MANRREAGAGVFPGANYSEEERDFLLAMERYMRTRRRRFPRFTEVLAVARSLGYRRVAEAGPLPRCSGDTDDAY